MFEKSTHLTSLVWIKTLWENVRCSKGREWRNETFGESFSNTVKADMNRADTNETQNCLAQLKILADNRINFPMNSMSENRDHETKSVP